MVLGPMLLLVSATAVAPEPPAIGDPFVRGLPREPQWYAAPQVDTCTDLRNPFAGPSSRRKPSHRDVLAGNDLRDPGWGGPSPRWSAHRLWAPDLRDPQGPGRSRSSRSVTVALVDPELRDPFLVGYRASAGDRDLRDPFFIAPAMTPAGPPVQRPRNLRRR